MKRVGRYIVYGIMLAVVCWCLWQPFLVLGIIALIGLFSMFAGKKIAGLVGVKKESTIEVFGGIIIMICMFLIMVGLDKLW